MKDKQKNYMKVLTDPNKSVGAVALEPCQIKRATYVGTFTIKVLREFIELLEETNAPEDSVDLHTLYSDESSVYILLASENPEEMVRQGVVGCSHGVDGRG
jgi:hypothetical protein